MTRRWSLFAAGGLTLAIVMLLFAFADVDPTASVTHSNSPFSDEAWNVLNARNFVLLGRWATDQFNLYLLTGPFSLLEAGIFSLLGVGIVQARIAPILAAGSTVLMLAVGLRRPFGSVSASLAAIAYGTSMLVLFYGRLAYPEVVLAAGFTAGALLSQRADGPAPARWGLLAGLCFGGSIATKLDAAFPVAGFVGAVVLLEGLSPSVRRWIVGVAFGIAMCGMAWLMLVFLPNPEAVVTDFRILHHFRLPHSLGLLVRRVASYPFASDGALPAMLPLALGAVLGTVAGFIHWRQLTAAARRFFVGSVAALVVGLAAVAVVEYRPSRYLLPVLPAAAILVAVAGAAFRERLGTWRPSRLVASAAMTALVLALPGLVSYATWMEGATRVLSSAQEAAFSILPSSAVVEGPLAPTLAMRAPVVTIVPWPGARANVGDLYVSRGVRWVVAGEGEHPAWAGLHPEVWAARRARYCFDWPPKEARVCLYELP